MEATLFAAGGYIVFGIAFLDALVNRWTPIIQFRHLSCSLFCIYDANISAQKINQEGVQIYQQKYLSNSLNLKYIPDEGLMASYYLWF